MNISCNNFYKSPQSSFSGKNISPLLQVIPASKVSKGLTQLDVECFKSYINARPFRMGIAMNEINNLMKFDGDNFLLKANEFLSKKMGLTDKVRPEFVIVDEFQSEGAMMYMPLNNVILCSRKKMNGLSKAEMYGGLRHEYQHYLQNILVLRHEDIGSQALDVMVKSQVESEKCITRQLIENCSDEELVQLFEDQQGSLAITLKAKKFLENGQNEEFNKLFEDYGKSYRELLVELQKNVKEHFGVITGDSPLTPKIRRNFEELFNLGYYEADNSVNWIKYFETGIEEEACNAQFAAEIEMNPQVCPFKYLKEGAIEAFEE